MYSGRAGLFAEADGECWVSAGTESASESVLQTVIRSAQKPEEALAFNYASEALNNSFFLSTLVSPTAVLSPHAHPLPSSLRHSE